jgi:hypothetical protein
MERTTVDGKRRKMNGTKLQPQPSQKLLPAHVATPSDVAAGGPPAGHHGDPTAPEATSVKADLPVPHTRTPAPHPSALTKSTAPTTRGTRAPKPRSSPRSAEGKSEGELTGPLNDAYVQITAILAAVTIGLARAVVDEILNRFKIGVIVAAIESSPGRYGNDPIGKLASKLGFKNSQRLYEYSAVAEAWSLEEIAALADREGADGYHLTWTHLIEVAREADAGSRNVLVERAFTNRWTVAELKQNKPSNSDAPSAAGKETPGAEAVDDVAGADVPPDAPKRKAPPAYRSGILEIASAAQQIVGRGPIWKSVIFEKFKKAKDKDLLDGTLGRDLEKAEEAVKRAAQFLDDQLKELSAMKARIQEARARLDETLAPPAMASSAGQSSFPVNREI